MKGCVLPLLLALLTNSRTWWLPFCMRWVTSLRSWLQRGKMAVLMSWRSMILLVRPSLVLRCRLSTRLPHPCLLKSFVSWSACLIVMVMLVWWLLLACLHRRLIGQLVNPIGAFVLLMAMNSWICGFGITLKCRKMTGLFFVSLLSIS